MQPLSFDKLKSIAVKRKVSYHALPADDEKTVKTKMSRSFPLSQEVVFDLFADPANHVKLFSIIKGSSTIPRTGIETVIGDNELYAVEHVEEANVTPRMMLIKYVLDRPRSIIKLGVPDPFSDLDPMADKKKAKVAMNFDPQPDGSTLVTVESEFQAASGAVFTRGFIDHVWLNFFENMMVETGMIRADKLLTSP